MPYRVKILAHSVGPDQQEALTVEWEFPRIVLAEVVTHRKCRDNSGEYELVTSERTTTEDVSKNSASSRAIPLWRMIQKVMDDPYVPEKFSKTGPGMQAAGWLEGEDHRQATLRWLDARDQMIGAALDLASESERQKVFDAIPAIKKEERFLAPVLSHGVHKQDVNRLLEPFAWVTQVVTADGGGWNNFFALRCHKFAHPAFQKVARMAYLLYRDSVPRKLDYGQWHLPFVDFDPEFRYYPSPFKSEPLPDPIKFSSARCGWVSYENHDKDGTPEAMLKTFDRFLAEPPVHASVVEHQLCPMTPAVFDVVELRSNVVGWVQARKLVKGERTLKYEPSAEEVASWGMT